MQGKASARRSWRYSPLFSLFVLLTLRLDAEDFRVPPKIDALTNPVPRTAEILTQARADYEKYCRHCHGPSGLGDGPTGKLLPTKPVDLSDARGMEQFTDGRIFYAISEGIHFMPGFKSKLTDRQRWGLVRLVRSMSAPQREVPRPR
jgi:mono/diheme cytochrome c family protein